MLQVCCLALFFRVDRGLARDLALHWGLHQGLSKVGVVPEDHLAAKFLNDHLAYCESETNTALVDIVFDMQAVEELSDFRGVLDA